MTSSGEMSRVVSECAQLREELGVHALEYCNRFNLSRRDRSLAAMMMLLSAAREVARCINAAEAFQALCAAEVPAKGLDVIIRPESMQ